MAKISIVLATYNSEKFIAECLQSVLNQTFSDFEILIVDDHSTDDTFRYLQSMAKSDKRIQLFRNEANKGIGYNYRYLLKKCAGKLIAQIGHDDCWDENYLIKASNYFDAQPTCAAVVANVRVIDENGKKLENKIFKHGQTFNYNQQNLVLRLYTGNLICASAVVFQRELLGDGFLTIDLDQFQDWMTWLSLALNGPFYFSSEQLVSYRVHQGNLSLAGRSSALSQLEVRWLRSLFLKSKELSQFVMAQADPDKFLFELFGEVDRSINLDKVEDVVSIFQAIREQEFALGGLPTYRATLGTFYWYFGAFKKSSNYLNSVEYSNPWVKTLSSMTSRNTIVFNKEAVGGIPSFFIKVKKLGPCYRAQIRLRNAFLPIIHLSLLPNTKDSYLTSLERLIFWQGRFRFAQVIKLFKGNYIKCLIPKKLDKIQKKTTDLELGNC